MISAKKQASMQIRKPSSKQDWCSVLTHSGHVICSPPARQFPTPNVRNALVTRVRGLSHKIQGRFCIQIQLLLIPKHTRVHPLIPKPTISTPKPTISSPKPTHLHPLDVDPTLPPGVFVLQWGATACETNTREAETYKELCFKCNFFCKLRGYSAPICHKTDLLICKNKCL